MTAQPLSVLQTCFSRSWGGLEMQALEISKGLRDRGHRVLLATLPDNRLNQEAAREGIPVLPLNVTGYAHPILLWRLRNALRANRIDIIHCQHSRDLATVVPALQLSGMPISLVLSKRVGSYINKRDLFHRYTHRRIGKVLAISDVIRRNVIATTPVPAGRVITFHDAVDTQKFSPAKVDRFGVRREMGIPDASLVVGFVGRFSPGKGVEELLHAARKLRDVHPPVRFLVAGEASHAEEAYARSIHHLAEQLGLQQTVVFTGYRSDVPEVMASFDILAFPSHAESFGVVLIEAMAMEKPVVSTNCDGVLDIVVDGVTGIYVPPKDAEALAAGIERLIAHPELREQYGRAGRLRVLEHFDQSRQLQKLEAVYFSLLNESTRC
jgi:glycosyltransferase involved in cell wall biosynthesis